MRSLQHGLGKRIPLFFTFNAGGSFGFSPVFDFNNNPVTAPVTENPFLASPAAAPIGNTLDSFTSSVNNPTAYSFYNSGVSLDDSAKSFWAASGALSFEADGKLFSEGSLNVYKVIEDRNIETEKRTAELNAKQQEANAKNIELILTFLKQLFEGIGSMVGGAVPTGMAAAPSTNNAAAT